ncbi:MAG TPA: cytochrome ubiquinol oxidase subunit I [Solirubrobacteraceae bacterium]|jgi:cytochrome d ubiquinol oxidase subunit I|nr:cytochrome ubiquinol oxidase subunit I [Solirubrobacteraceae bacterium]
MTNDLARWQFATTSIYHFLFVPVTIGLAFLVALLQTAWHRNEKPEYKRMTRFFGTLLLINVAVGVVTGLVQEFEFGMNWSTYSRFVGDVFGGPLAMEGLAAFFLESTFLGLWIFGWDRLPKRIHLACIWLVVAGSMLSALFILVANSWMQHPVGYVLNSHGQPVLNNVWALFTNPTFLWGYVHVILASLVTGSLVMLAISAWYLRALNGTPHVGGQASSPKGIPHAGEQASRQSNAEAFHHTARLSVLVLLPAILLQMFVGNKLGEIEATYQPAKIAAAEAQWSNCQPCSFSAFQIGGGNNDQTPTQVISIPHLLSILATGTWGGAVVGLNQLQKEDEEKYGPGNYIPDVFIQYWSMRVMAYLGSLIALLALWGTWLIHKGRLDRSKWFLRAGLFAVVTPFVMNTAGWLLTESGRQPWIVQGLMKTVNANSPSVSSLDIWISLIAFVLVYIALGAADLILMLRYSRKGLDPDEGSEGTSSGAHPPTPVMSY